MFHSMIRRRVAWAAVIAFLLSSVAGLAPGLAAAASADASSVFACSTASGGGCSGDILVIGLGDSIASGYGLADDGTACRRSQDAYAYKLADRIESDTTRDATVDLLACSGATIGKPDDSTLSQDPDKWLYNQVTAANQKINSVPADQTVVVAITAGADDLDFVSNFPLLTNADDSALNAKVSSTASEVSSNLKPDLESLLAHANVRVVVTGINNPLNPTSVFFTLFGGQTCKSINPAGSVDCYGRANDTITTLNTALQQTVTAVHGESGIGDRVSFAADVFGQFQQHFASAPICGGASVETSWIQQPASLIGLANLQNGNDCIHPDAAGAQAYADAALTSLYASEGFAIGDVSAMAKVWASTDSVVANQTVNRTWIWGPEANTSYVVEPYQKSGQANASQAPAEWRVVQYFDKSRMEITNPNGDTNADWYITNGLLAEEMITGRMQLGDDLFVQHDPAQVNVAGDLNDPNGPTYATFNPLMTYGAIPNGWIITQTVSRAGEVTADSSLSSYGVTSTDVGAPTKHNVASVFWAFMNSSGPIDQNGQVVNGKLFSNPFYATGYPITEPYWTHVLVGGVSKLVLVQVFERRVLTYTPSNPDGWKVEAGNVGLQYYQWRYGGN